jgi:hypothetical protein
MGKAKSAMVFGFASYPSFHSDLVNVLSSRPVQATSRENMSIARVVIKNYRRHRDSTIDLDDKLNIVVGDNECGKSTFLEAIHLALSGQLNGRPIHSEVHPYLFNTQAVKAYIDSIIAKKPIAPPSITIEIYFSNDASLARLKGTNNSRKDDLPGITLSIEYNDEYNSEYRPLLATARDWPLQNQSGLCTLSQRQRTT